MTLRSEIDRGLAGLGLADGDYRKVVGPVAEVAVEPDPVHGQGDGDGAVVGMQRHAGEQQEDREIAAHGRKRRAIGVVGRSQRR